MNERPFDQDEPKPARPQHAAGGRTGPGATGTSSANPRRSRSEPLRASEVRPRRDEPAPAAPGRSHRREEIDLRTAAERGHGDDEPWPDERWDDRTGYDDPVDVDPGYGYDDEEYSDEEDEFVEVRPARSGARKVLFVFLGLLVVLALVAGVGLLWVQRQIDPSGPAGEAVTLEIPPRTSGAGVARLLEDSGVISSAFVWNWYLRWKGVDSTTFEAGLYEFRENSHFDEAITVLQGGPAPPDADRFTVPEGLTVDQIVDRLADPERGLGFDPAVMRELLDSGEIRSRYQPDDQPSPEGILFPNTYEVPPDIDERGALQMMVDQLDQTLAELDVERAQERFNLTPYEILIVASLIERETRVDAERPMVAQVIYNRLRQGIALGIDATSCYEKREDPCRLTTADLEGDTPYNTRRRPGLVPTPIASPGRASIEAALEPADGPWIYYVLQDEEGNHFFTDSASEFQQAVQVCEERGLGCG